MVGRRGSERSDRAGLRLRVRDFGGGCRQIGWARKVWAVDIDPQALLASDDNADRNGVEDRIELAVPAELPAELNVDIVLANILAGMLVRLAPEFGRRVRPGGRLVLSGILEPHAEAVQPPSVPTSASSLPGSGKTGCCWKACADRIERFFVFASAAKERRGPARIHAPRVGTGGNISP